MEAFLVSITTISVAEIGDRTQLLSLLLAARFRRPWPIIAGILCATLANHGVAGFRRCVVRRPAETSHSASRRGHQHDRDVALDFEARQTGENAGATSAMGAFLATLTSFFLAEIGDKTQIATLALAAAYPNLLAVVAGTTAGMLLANVPVVFLGKAFADRLPLKAIHLGAAALFMVLGVVFLVARALALKPGEDRQNWQAWVT